MGTEIQRREPSQADFEGNEGLNEILVLTRPDIILDIHRSFLAAGSDVVETDSFGANAVVLSEYGVQDRTAELNLEAARLAREAADEFSTPDRPRFVSGSVGPGTKLPSLGQISFAELHSAFKDQIAGLLQGGVDLIQIETCQDPLQARAAVIAAAEAQEKAGRHVPVFCQLTFEPTGALLLGTEPAAAIVSLASVPGIDVLGMNCATGPDSMHPLVRELSRTSPFPISVLPNAGLPEARDGKLVYNLGPDEFAGYMVEFVRDFGVSFAGGCCGTQPEHIAALARALKGIEPGKRTPLTAPAAASLFSAVTLDQDPRPLIIGERTNANGSKAFRGLLEAGDLDGMLGVAVNQAEEGAHLLDVCLAMTGRDETADARAFIPKLRQGVDIPLVYDSTEPEAIEAALQAWPGRAVINSVNLEDGGARLERVAAVTRRHGGALVVLCIDEEGMCMTARRKAACAARIVEKLEKGFGFARSDLLVDALTFTLGSGDETLKDSAVQTLEGIRLIKAEIPGVYTSLGVSNVSFGLAPRLRRVLNSVFLHHAVEAGLDAAILNAGKVLPLAEIPDELRDLAEDLVFNRVDEGREGSGKDSSGKDPLERFMSALDDGAAFKHDRVPPEADDRTIEERLHHRIVRGDKNGLEADIEEALRSRAPMAIINEILLGGMKEVGELFGRGDMQLPFVLKAAEVMKASVKLLEPHMDRSDLGDKGTLVLATVRGDVHDIGKNLVDILLSNNGYRVINLGTRQSIESVMQAAEREDADAIGLSGLLVKSTLVMRDDLIELQRKNRTLPVLLGGAALNRKYVNGDLKPLYDGEVTYCRDAFAGLDAMDALAAGDREGAAPARIHAAPKPDTPKPDPKRDHGKAPPLNEGAPLEPAESIPNPPFFGARVVSGVSLEDAARYVNRLALFRRQWQFKRGKGTEDEWRARVKEELEPMFMERLDRYGNDGTLRPAAIRGYFPANSDGNALVVFDPDGLTERARFILPRQSKPPGRCLADFFLPISSGRRDVLAVQIATMGPKASQTAQSLFEDGQYTEYLYLHGMGVELAEGLAEHIHARIREELGINGDDAGDTRDILKGSYRGCRYSFGYPACPDLEGQKALLDLLGADRIGVSLTESFQMVPEQSTSAIVVHHQQAGYFAV
ncbi:MAG: methionine synthase [Deltaproteobacteria bacterium]|nr:methionine synthase [Deltaproteobacteria bacterium]